MKTDVMGMIDNLQESVRVVQERTTVAKRERRVGEPRQPDTAYTFFWKSRRKQVMEESPHLSGPLVSREVGRLWKSLGVEDRKVRHINEGSTVI